MPRKTVRHDKALQAGAVFSPAAPIREKDVFAGRTEQIRAVIDAVHQKGQHVLIYGERGVGKTSLANVLESFLPPGGKPSILAPHINCDQTDNFTSIWRKVFQQIPIIEESHAMGFRAQTRQTLSRLAEHVEENITPNTVLAVSLSLTREHWFIPIIDEFDRLASKEAAKPFTDTIKALSDQSPNTTLVLVAVADTVEELVAEHHSVERALVQVRMPRMSRAELMEIIIHGVRSLGMKVDSDANEYIATLSQGLPHYTHLLGLHATRQAIDGGDNRVRLRHVDAAVRKAIDQAQQTLRRAYHQATMSPRSDSLYGQVLLACALAQTDPLGYFAAVDVRDPMSRIMNKRYEIAAFSRHLADFCDPNRGPVLDRTGIPRRFRFRFRNPLLQPFVIIQGLADGLISRADIRLLQREQDG